MASCSTNTRIGRIGCTDTFTGEMQHCVARASWSTHPDGIAHITASHGIIDQLWRLGNGREPANPAAHPDLFEQRSDTGRWSRVQTDEDRERWARLKADPS